MPELNKGEVDWAKHVREMIKERQRELFYQHIFDDFFGKEKIDVGIK